MGVTALKQRYANQEIQSVGGQPVGLSEYRCDVYSCRCVRTTGWAAVCGLSDVCANEGVRKTGEGRKYETRN